jgi:Alpha-L-arabinofuranosidase B, catalytic
VRGLLLAALLAVLLPASAHAQFNNNCGGTSSFCQPKGAGGAAYVGPGDLVSGAAAAYSVRCYTASQAGASQAINIRRASDNTAEDIGFTSSCNLNVAAATTFCVSTTCFVATWYDLSGNGQNATQATAAMQPQLVLANASINGQPSPVFAGAQNMTFTGPSLTQPFTFMAVAERNGAVTNNSEVLSASGAVAFSFASATGSFLVFAGNSVTATGLTESVAHAFGGLFNSTASEVAVDGSTAATGNANTAGTGTAYIIGNISGGGQALTGLIPEIIVYSGNQSASFAAIRANQKSYFGTP